MDETQTIELAKEILTLEANSLLSCKEKINKDFYYIAAHINRTNRVLFSGIGKSALVAKKITSSFNSIGVHAHFIHAVEALHGDWGMHQAGDMVIILSNSGSCEEIKNLIDHIIQSDIIIAAITGQPDSYLAKKSMYVLNAFVGKEADTLNVLPTASTAVAMALGDALVVAVMKMRNVTKKDFARFHPLGMIGKKLQH